MIVCAVSCPQPPLLLPGNTGRPVAEVEQLRAACLAAVAELVATGPDRLVMIGGRSAAESADRVPLSIEIGRLLLADHPGPVDELVVAGDAEPEHCLRLGRELALSEGRTGLLVLADGSARRGLKAPGYLDDRAAPFDSGIEAALANGDPAGLAALDAELAAELLVAGRAAWQVLAGATEGRTVRATLSYSVDPFGVWYPVSSWYPLEGSTA